MSAFFFGLKRGLGFACEKEQVHYGRLKWYGYGGHFKIRMGEAG